MLKRESICHTYVFTQEHTPLIPAVLFRGNEKLELCHNSLGSIDLESKIDKPVICPYSTATEQNKTLVEVEKLEYLECGTCTNI